MSTSPPGDSPFRGGFRFLPAVEGAATIDAWGAELAELVSRAMEGVFRAAGVPETLKEAPPFRLEARAPDVPSLIGQLSVAALGRLRREGRYARVVNCRSVVAVEPGGTLEPGVAVVLICDGGFVDADGDPGLKRIAPTDDPVGFWEENGILRARFHVMERPPALDEMTPEGEASS